MSELNDNPFAEEFDASDVVNNGLVDDSFIDDPAPEPLLSLEDLNNQDGVTPKNNKIKHKKSKKVIHSEDKDKKLDLDSITNYDEELAKQSKFQSEYGTHIEQEEEQRLQENFNDFLITKRIAGRAKGYSNANRIPKDIIRDDGDFCEIIDEPALDDIENPSTVIIHRNDNNEIVSLDVYCKCGNKLKIRIDYEKTEQMPDFYSIGIIAKDSSKDPNLIPEYSNRQFNEAAVDYLEKPEYYDSLLNDMDTIAEKKVEKINHDTLANEVDDDEIITANPSEETSEESS